MWVYWVKHLHSRKMLAARWQRKAQTTREGTCWSTPAWCRLLTVMDRDGMGLEYQPVMLSIQINPEANGTFGTPHNHHLYATVPVYLFGYQST